MDMLVQAQKQATMVQELQIAKHNLDEGNCTTEELIELLCRERELSYMILN